MTELECEIGSIHGRFQPFHNGHLEYALGALRKSNHLMIGITQFEIEALKWSGLDIAKHRSEPSANPFSYVERVEIIESALKAEGVGSDNFTIVPFPIETPNMLDQYLRKDAVIFTTVYDDWNRSKIKLLRDHGYDVRVLWERTYKEYEGRVIRDLIAANDSTWTKMVPKGAVEPITRFLAAK